MGVFLCLGVYSMPVRHDSIFPFWMMFFLFHRHVGDRCARCHLIYNFPS